MRIARRVDVVLQNHTRELLTIEGGVNIQGEWNPQLGAPKLGAVVPKQASAKWSSISPQRNMPIEANVRLGCTKGYIDIRWWLGAEADEFTVTPEAPAGLAIAHEEGGPNDDYRVVLVTLTPA